MNRAIVAFVASALLFGACHRTNSRPNCVADSITTLQLLPSVPGCESEAVCRDQCLAGNGPSCLRLAYRLEENSKNAEEAERLYRRACVLGVANGCTNYAAAIWAEDPPDAELTCARRIFEKSCAAGEPFACGMVGRVMLESTNPPPFAEGRKYLEESCDKVGGFPCRVLAKHLESGKLGAYDPKLIRTLLTRACAGGDPDACGEPATAAETFR